MIDKIKDSIKEHFSLQKNLLNLTDDINHAHKIIINTLKKGNKIMFCGNVNYI